MRLQVHLIATLAIIYKLFYHVLTSLPPTPLSFMLFDMHIGCHGNVDFRLLASNLYHS